MFFALFGEDAHKIRRGTDINFLGVFLIFKALSLVAAENFCVRSLRNVSIVSAVNDSADGLFSLVPILFLISFNSPTTHCILEELPISSDECNLECSKWFRL